MTSADADMSWSSEMSLAAISLGRIVYCAIIDRSISDSELDVTPICITRLVADTIGYICGGSHQLGRLCAVACRRSWTSCRACRTLVPRRKYSQIAESCGSESDRTL